MVKSKVDHFFEREVLRQTWGRHDKNDVIQRVFLIGLPNNSKKSLLNNLTQRIMIESAHYGDIVQKDFLDAYHNNTLQILMGLKWATEFCSNVN